MNSASTTTGTTSADVRIYTLRGCGACSRARRLLRRRGIAFDEVKGSNDPAFRESLQRITGGSTVPQILIDDRPVGGADDLAALDRSGALLPLTRREPFPRVVVRHPFRWLRRRTELHLIDATGKTLEIVRPELGANVDELVAELASKHSDRGTAAT